MSNEGICSVYELAGADPSGGKDTSSCGFSERYLDRGWAKLRGLAIEAVLFLGEGADGEGMRWMVKVSEALAEIGRKPAPESDHAGAG